MYVDPHLTRTLNAVDHSVVSPFAIPPQRELVYPEGKIPIVRSLDAYADSVNANGFDEIVRKYSRVGRFMTKEMPEGSKFKVGAFGWCNKFCPSDQECPFHCSMRYSAYNSVARHIDGDYGLTFGVECPDLEDTLWCATTSFVFAGRLNLVSDTPLRTPLPDTTPIIAQFQGASSHSHRGSGGSELSRRTKGILGRTPWEYILGDLTINWWKNISDDSMYFLPPEYSTHLINSEYAERAIQKIQTVARDLGFVDDPTTGLYRLG